jgi:hypothetical protein
MKLNKLVQAAMFAAIAVGVGFSLLLVPNVELITLTIFLSGLVLGPSWGLLVGGTAEVVFSSLNPLGSGLSFPPLFISQVVSMMLIGVTGGLCRPFFYRSTFNLGQVVALGLVGFVLTFLYDSLTTLSYPLSTGFNGPQLMGVYLTGLGFTFLHQIWNAAVFALGVPKIVQHLTGVGMVTPQR